MRNLSRHGEDIAVMKEILFISDKVVAKLYSIWAALDLINIVLLAIAGICFGFVILILSLTDTRR
jgi:hypothetical protein